MAAVVAQQQEQEEQQQRKVETLWDFHSIFTIVPW